MGAETFKVVRQGKNAKEAFQAAVSEAQYMDGHGGYTGTIAEKRSFVIIDEPKCSSPKEASQLAERLIDEGDERIDDKWGPAGCIPLPDNTFLFFGWASS